MTAKLFVRRFRLHAPGGHPASATRVRRRPCGGTPGGRSRSLTFVVLGGFVVYATWAAFQGDHYEYGPYLSPFYSPLLFGEGPHSWFGPWPSPGWWPAALPFSAALLILWAPGGFRFTCYYYRGAYYKAFWADPPSCAVGEPRKAYRGEQLVPADPAERPPLLPLSRAGVPVRAGLRRVEGDVVHRRRYGQTTFGIGVGTLVLAINSGAPLQLHARLPFVPPPRRRRARPVLTASARSRRCTTRPAASTAVTCDGRGPACSRVALADLYVRLCSMGVLTDWRIF